MKLCTKKVYCPHCSKLVRCKDEKGAGSTTKITCNICGKTIYVWNGASWNPGPEA